MWYAISHATGLIIEQADHFRECVDKARTHWDAKPGTTAPYYLTTIPPLSTTKEAQP